MSYIEVDFAGERCYTIVHKRESREVLNSGEFCGVGQSSHMMNNDRRSLTALLQRATLTAERQSFSAKFLPRWLTSSTYQPRVQIASADVNGDLFGCANAEFTERPAAEIKAVNWLRTGVRLRLIKQNRRLGVREVHGDAMGSLLMAVSTVLWGHLDVNDDHLIACLRQVLLDNLLSNTNHDSQMAGRWKQHNDVVAAGVDLASNTPARVNETWTDVLCTGDVVNLHAIHIFTLSQVVCRPIIVVLDNPRTTADVDRLSGIYLPLLQPLSSCCRYPVVLALDSQSRGFLPLVTTRPVSPADAEMVVPLCSGDLEPLEVRCLQVAERPDSLLETYLRVTELPCTRTEGVTHVPVARLDGQTAASFDELWDNVRANDDAPADDDLPHCSSQGCRYYALTEYSGKCLQCHKNNASVSEPPQPRRLLSAEEAFQFIADEEGKQKHNENENKYIDLAEDIVKKCTNASCEERGSRYYNGFCAACYIDPDRHCAARQDVLQPPNHAPAVPGGLNGDVERFYGNAQTSSAQRRVTFAPETVPVRVGNGQLAEEHHGGNTPCMSEGCLSYATSGSILCVDCERQQRLEFERLEESQRHRRHPQRSEHRLAQPQQPWLPQRQRRSVYCTGPTPVTAGRHLQVEPGQRFSHLSHGGVARPCASGDCDRYGDANYDGFCSVCYVNYRR